jgi:hypothetical protein
MRGMRRGNIGKGRKKGEKRKKNEAIEAKNNGKRKRWGSCWSRILFAPACCKCVRHQHRTAAGGSFGQELLQAAKLCQSETAVLRAQQPELTDRLQTMSHCPVKLSTDALTTVFFDERNGSWHVHHRNHKRPPLDVILKHLKVLKILKF